jgi:hypothetical protein
MSKSAVERHAIFTVHGEKCYICRSPLTLSTMTVDHVIPKTLVDKPDVLAQELIKLGRPADFDLNSYANMLPACSPCNMRKSDTIWEPSLLVQLVLQDAKAKAPKVAALVDETLGEREIAKALNTLERAKQEGRLTEEQVMRLSRYQDKVRNPEQAGEPLLLAPNIRILYLTAPVGFTEKTLDLFREHEHVHAIIKAERAADGRYHDIWLWVTEKFADFAIEYARLHAD